VTTEVHINLSLPPGGEEDIARAVRAAFGRQRIMTQVPTIGRIVHYRLSEQDADAINRRRADAYRNRAEIAESAVGYVAHSGNSAAAGDVYPMVVVRAWGGEADSHVNGQVLLDGNDTLWVTSVTAGDGPRSFFWPPRS
jgi:hypothetical protein